jgi:redox-sensitive bicupin YhaK (pirin superfamily)
VDAPNLQGVIIMKPREVAKQFKAEATPEGVGVTVHRSIGTRAQNTLDPFLLLDEFVIAGDAKGAGFPDHPHRGFETVTYMLSGRMEHADSAGNGGVIGPGEVQWMTAGGGVVHSEMPKSDGEEIRGMQLWVNLPAAEKMQQPRYQDIAADLIPEVDLGDNGSLKVVAGSFGDATGPAKDISVQPLYLDLRLRAGGSTSVRIPEGHAAFIYCLEGGLALGEKVIEVGQRSLAVLTDGDQIKVTAVEGAARAVLVAAAPIGEPIVRYGPFVMNTRQEILQAIKDFQFA